jgi:hypothetical protein
MRILILFLAAQSAFAGMSRLEMSLATCQVDTVKQLLTAGADPNSKDGQGRPIIRWLASNQKCTDDTALATLQLLAAHGAKFESKQGSPSFLTGFATRGFAKSLGFLALRKESGNPTDALRAIARRDDLASIRVLLKSGADPLSGVALSSSLMDATFAGHADSVREMLNHVTDKQAEKVLAAYKYAKKTGDDKLTQVFLNAGVKPPPEPETFKVRCPRQELPPAVQKLAVHLRLPDDCKFVQECGEMVLVDCNSAADGPAYYIDQKSGTILSTCGGACMGGHCTKCPPPGWSCECKL